MHSATAKVKTDIYPEQDRSTENLSDAFEILVQKSMDGDKDALYELCSSITRDVLFRTKYVLGNISDAEDVAQEIMIRVCKNIDTLRDAKSFRAWLNSIVYNETNRYMVRNNTRGVVVNIEDYTETIIDETEEISPQWSVENKEDHSLLMSIIASLSTCQREVIMMHYFDGLSVAESAKILGIARQNAAANLMRGRENIKYQLQKNNRMSAYTAMPIGTFLSWAFQQESSISGIANETAFQSIMTNCNVFIQTGKEVTASTAPKAAGLIRKLWIDLVLGICVAAIITTAALLLVNQKSEEPRFNIFSKGPALAGNVLEDVENLTGEGRIIYSGGVDYGNDIVYINPESAKPHVNDQNIPVETLYWWITQAGSDITLYRGDGYTVDGALRQLREEGENGEYMLYYRLTDETGALHKVGKNFYILVGYGT